MRISDWSSDVCSSDLQIHSSVEPAGDEPVIVKNRINAFLGTNLKQVLEANGTEEVTVIGAKSHMCIASTTRAASDHGYRTTVVHDACAPREPAFAGQVVPARQVPHEYMSALAFPLATFNTETAAPNPHPPLLTQLA